MLDASLSLVPDAVLTPTSSPQAALVAYENLIAIGASPPAWLSLADRLQYAATQCAPAFRLKYLDRARDCMERAA
jgi:hypothetical protein